MRKMLEGLSFITESEPHRLRLYYYMFRNQFYIARKGYWRKDYLFCVISTQK